jgi:Bacterial antitoxin of type II TA system, VapB
MMTNLNIDTDLLQEAIALDGEATGQALVEKALRSYIQYRKQLQVLDLFGTLDYDETYDYEQQRQIA